MSQDNKQLIIGCGKNRKKVIYAPGEQTAYDSDAVYLDINPDHNPTIVWDLNNLPLPFKDNEFKEIHAYSILEHLGSQGDYKSFFALFDELYRILKNNGLIFGVTPHQNSIWAFGDPGHTRIINSGTLTFLDRSQYDKQVGYTAMTDYRNVYHGNFNLEFYKDINEFDVCFVLRAIKEGL